MPTAASGNLATALRSLAFGMLAWASVVTGVAAQSHRDHAGANPATMEGRGKGVHFATSCADDAQAKFEAALAALHSFWYAQALKEFTAIAEQHPDCAIAYWGVAMSLWTQLWAPPRADALAKGFTAIESAKGASAKSPREQDFINAAAEFYTGADKSDHRTRALAYSRAMGEVHARYPEDREAGMFYALSLMATADPLDRGYANQRKAGGILEAVFAELPEHPGPAHYIIHAYDYPQLVERALPAAERYAEVARTVPHAIHMPSHTYVLLGRWEDTIRSNTRGVEAERARGIPEDELHDIDYLVYAYLQLGQDEKAKEARDLALRIEDDLVAKKRDVGLRARPFTVAAVEARYALERGDWKAAAELPLRPHPTAFIDAIPHFARAVGLARSGRPEEGRPELERLAALHNALLEQKSPYWARQVDIQLKIASAWTARAQGRDDEAVALLQAAAELEGSAETHDTLSPGPIGTTAQEALGELLLELKRPGEALAAFEDSLHTSKNRLRGVTGAVKAAAAAGAADKARTYSAQLAELTRSADARPEVIEAKALASK